MIKICVAGACGRMGRRILERAAAAEDIEVAGLFELPAYAGVELLIGQESGRGRTYLVSEHDTVEIGKADVLIDFTAPSACIAHVSNAADLGKAAVVGTTGLSESQRAELEAMAKRIPIVYAPNMSVGVNLLFKLTREIAQVLGDEFDIEIVEIHHNRKKDSPSGTAVRLGERAAEGRGLDYGQHAVHGREGIVGERTKEELGMHAVRGGDVTGDHTVYFLGQGERIELTHRAHSRDTFAQGALRAARFAYAAKPGLYDMQDVLGLR